MIHFEGDRRFSQPRELVAGKLADATFLVSCLDKVDQVVEATPDRAVWKLRTGFSFLSTTLEVTLTVTERSSEKATYTALSKGIGATSLVKAELTFQPAEGGSNVHYVAEVAERTGLLKVVSSGLIQAAAKSVIEDTWQAIEKKLSSE
jgi:carbon monoxide dehydrogenase subunit G